MCVSGAHVFGRCYWQTSLVLSIEIKLWESFVDWEVLFAVAWWIGKEGKVKHLLGGSWEIECILKREIRDTGFLSNVLGFYGFSNSSLMGNLQGRHFSFGGLWNNSAIAWKFLCCTRESMITWPSVEGQGALPHEWRFSLLTDVSEFTRFKHSTACQYAQAWGNEMVAEGKWPQKACPWANARFW